MKNNLLLCMVLCACRLAAGQAYGGLEQYTYLSEGESPVLVPILHLQNKTWYGEVRYNYEKLQSLSVYAGKIYTIQNKRGIYSCSLTPIAGIVLGKFKGGSLGLNLKIEYHDLFLTSQSQYTFSLLDQRENFVYSWSEVGYQPWHWIYGGLAVQQTNLFQENKKQSGTEAGVVIGFILGPWTIPLYSFSPFTKGQYFIVGLTLNLGNDHGKIR